MFIFEDWRSQVIFCRVDEGYEWSEIGTFLRGALDKAGLEPQVKRIGNYKSAGDQLLREEMSDYQKEQLQALLDDIYNGDVSAALPCNEDVTCVCRFR